MYGWWDSAPGRPEARARWFHHFDLYRPMVQSGTHVWIDVTEASMFASPLPGDVTASLFVNTETYLVLANYGTQAAEFVSPWTWRDRETGRTEARFRLPPRDLLFLQRTAPEPGMAEVGGQANT